MLFVAGASPVNALFQRRRPRSPCLFTGVKRTRSGPRENDANDPIRTLARPRLLVLHLHNCEAFIRKRRACRIPNGSSRRASLR
jgi:hypothetical protein